MNQTCQKCANAKPLTAFYKQSRDKGRERGHWKVCKSCVSAERKLSGADRIKKYGIPPEEYKLRLFAQVGVCGICGEPANDPTGFGEPRAFAVDHNHRCCPEGRGCPQCIRGLLCNNCNKGLGNFQDNVKILRAAVTYLETWNDAQCFPA